MQFYFQRILRISEADEVEEKYGCKYAWNDTTEL
jgi:hypothetical protein